MVYKSLDNLVAYRLWFGVQPDTKAATLIFGLQHGFGVATKIQNHEISANGLLGNLIAFNIGVELGQLLALVLFLTVMAQWRARPAFMRRANAVNVLMMVAGFGPIGC